MTRIARLMVRELLISPDDDESDEPHICVDTVAKENATDEESFFDHTPTVAIITSLEDSSVIIIESNGFDPYNSGRFESSKSSSKK